MQMQKLKKFFAPEAFEQRARDRERRELVAELEDLDRMREYFTGRKGALLSRMNLLNRDDVAATLAESKVAAASPAPVVLAFAALGQSFATVSAPATLLEAAFPPYWSADRFAKLAGVSAVIVAALCLWGYLSW